MAKIKIDGMKELEKTIKKLGNLPQSMVTKSAKAGANIALKDARKDAPEDIGNLKKGIILYGEKVRARSKGKKVYQVVMDSGMNSTFVKMSADGKKRYYYPASQNYGYMTRDGGYVPGVRFMENSIQKNEAAITKKIVEVMGKEIDKILK